MKFHPLFLTITLFIFSTQVFSETEDNQPSSSAPLDNQFPILLSLATTVTPLRTDFAEVTSISHFKNLNNESMELTFLLPKNLDASFKSLSTTFEQKLIKSHLKDPENPDLAETHRGKIRSIPKPDSHGENTSVLVIGTLHPEEILEISFKLMKSFEKSDENIFRLDLPLLETGVTFVSPNQSKTTLSHYKLINKASALTDWNITVENTSEMELSKVSSWVKYNETDKSSTKFTIKKDELESADNFVIYYQYHNLTQQAEKTTEPENSSNSQDNNSKEGDHDVSFALLRRGNFRILSTVYDPAKDSKENPNEDILKKMYGTRIEDKERAKAEAEAKKQISEEEKVKSDAENDDMITKIVMGVFFFTIFLWVVSRILIWYYKRENASLGVEAEEAEKEYTEKYNKAQNRRTKKHK